MMLSKHYELTEVDRETLQHLLSGLNGPPTMTLTK